MKTQEARQAIAQGNMVPGTQHCSGRAVHPSQIGPVQTETLSVAQERLLLDVRQGKALFAFERTVDGLYEATLATPAAVVFVGNPIKRTVQLPTLRALLRLGMVQETRRVMVRAGTTREGIRYQCWRIDYGLPWQQASACPPLPSDHPSVLSVVSFV
jgi:hypothetical protein